MEEREKMGKEREKWDAAKFNSRDLEIKELGRRRVEGGRRERNKEWKKR